MEEISMKHINLRYLSFVLILVVFVAPFIRNNTSPQILRAAAHDFSETGFSQEFWLEYGREMSAANGLVNEALQEDIAVMTYGSYSVLIGQNPNPVLMSRESLVVVYQVLGDVPILNGFSLAAGRTDIAGFIFVYNAQTGVNVLSTALVKGKPGVLDLSFIPADTGTLPYVDLAKVPTTIPVDTSEIPLPTQLPPESTAELLPLPLN
jgi:hypothetical protein